MVILPGLWFITKYSLCRMELPPEQLAYGHTLDRACWIDNGVFDNPLFVSEDATNSALYDHETGFTYDSLNPVAESGPMQIGVGERLAHVTKLIPDEKTQGDVSVKFKYRQYPNEDPETTTSAYSMANPTSVRFSGRQVKMRVEGDRLADWRVGQMRVEVAAGERR